MEKAHEFGVAARVVASDAVFPGQDLADDYNACDVCVQASREEGLGFSVLEAMACGTPVVASAVGGLKETVREGETGWSYPAGNADALASCISEVFEKPSEAVARTSVGQKMVREMYKKEEVFSRLADVFAEVAAKD